MINTSGEMMIETFNEKIQSIRNVIYSIKNTIMLTIEQSKQKVNFVLEKEFILIFVFDCLFIDF